MIRIKDHKRGNLFDPWSFLGPKRRQLLSELPVDRIAPFFTDGFGRPTKELYTVLGVFVLEQARDLIDKEALNDLAFNTQWHYALNITEESDSAKYMSLKTLWNMRNIVLE